MTAEKLKKPENAVGKAESAKTSPKKLIKPTAAESKFDPWSVLLYPHIAEKSMSLVDIQNKIVFVVRLDSNKKEIKKAFESLFDVKVAEIKTERTIQGQKKAFVKLDPKYSAADIATKLGVL